MHLVRWSQMIVSVCILLVAQFVSAANVDAKKGPHQTIDEATVELLQLITDAKTYFSDDPERYYREIDTLVTPLIEFSSFARSVMGPYGSKEYYRSLKTKEERAAFKANYKRFVKTFREGLINTYAKGLLAFSGEKIAVLPATDAQKALIAAGKSVKVKQQIHGQEKVYTITYKMRPNKKGEWKMRNVVIDSINVGQLYRNQFTSSMNKYDNDFARVIDNWVVDAQSAETPTP